ncbi:MAG TPA: hypothetical protein VEK33_22195 [Terriglobales bacterium]|nr:hypothetical protein [Terriglobales bacterium]
MTQFSNALFREVKTDFFRVLAVPLASLYVDVLDALEREAVQRTHGLDRNDAIALVQQAVEQHNEIADLADESSVTPATPNGKARVIFASGTGESRRSAWSPGRRA